MDRGIRARGNKYIVFFTNLNELIRTIFGLATYF